MGGTSWCFPLFSNKAFERSPFGSKENRIRPAPSDTCEKYTSASRYLSWSLEHQIFRCCLYGHFGDVPFHIISSAREGIIICPSKEDLRRYIAEINLAMLACPGEENTIFICRYVCEMPRVSGITMHQSPLHNLTQLPHGSWKNGEGSIIWMEVCWDERLFQWLCRL